MQGEPSHAYQVRFSAIVYTLDTIKKAAYRFSDRCSFNFDVEGDYIICSISALKPLSPEEYAELQADFQNEVLDQDLRNTIGVETRDVRNAVLAYAFSRAGLHDHE
jgi:His-Xaa-Ser system protein HxsD